ncbi:MAG: penicillin-binding protein 1C [Candidatus Aminicenantales bacterium]
MRKSSIQGNGPNLGQPPARCLGFRLFAHYFFRLVLLFGLFLPIAFLLSILIPVPQSKLSPGPVVSLEIRDRNGKLLREVLSDERGRSHWVSLNEISPHLIGATIAAEDRAFPFHSGIDLVAIGRALAKNLSRRRVVSGASTISQQLARNIWPAPRTMVSKIREAWLALRLEHTLAKEEILVQYLNRIFYGNQTYGAEAASRLYFGKPCAELSLAEAAFLAALPRSPSLLNPYRSARARKIARERQQDILKRMVKLGFCSAEAAALALGEEISIVPVEIAFRAPHFCDWVLHSIPPEKRRELNVIQTTLDYELQVKMEAMLRRYLDSLSDRGITNGAVVVLDNVTGDVLSLVGSRDFFDEAKDGQVNGALARRQPGSTLKPFTYALALEKGLTAASMVDDTLQAFPTETGAYMPLNFDRRYHGPMRLREALACSYNVPAVSLLEKIGPDLLYRRLKSLGFESLDQSPAYYGIGLTLGNGEVTLVELVRAYATLARQGVHRTERTILRLGAKTGQSELQNEGAKRIFSPQVAFILTDILADRDARVPSFSYLSPLSLPFPVAAKTGTSKDFRDNWTVGYTPLYTVGIWVGNFDGKPMHNVSGITGCGPLFRDIMLFLHRNGWSRFVEPEGIVRRAVCPDSGELPTPFCPGAVEELFIAGTEPQALCSHHKPKLLSPRPSLSISSSLPPSLSSYLSSHSNARAGSSPPPSLSSPSSSSSSSSSSRSSPSSRSSHSSATGAAEAWAADLDNFCRERGATGSEPALTIVFPRDGDVFKIDPVLRVEHQRIKLRASVSTSWSSGNCVIEWSVNDQKVGQCSYPFAFFWKLKPGSYIIRAKLISGTRIEESRPVRIHILT